MHLFNNLQLKKGQTCSNIYLSLKVTFVLYPSHPSHFLLFIHCRGDVRPRQYSAGKGYTGYVYGPSDKRDKDKTHGGRTRAISAIARFISAKT